MIYKSCKNTSEGVAPERREYVDGLYEQFKDACKNGNKEKKMEIKKLLQAEGVNSYDYYSTSSKIAFILGVIAIIGIVCVTVIL